MDVVVEFAGLARMATKVRQCSLNVAEGTTFRDVLRILADQYPALIGNVLQPDGETLYPSNMLNLNGKRMIQPLQMEHSPHAGDHIILMSVLAGG